MRRLSAWFWAWPAFFLMVNTALEQAGNTNPHSRFALLCALVEDHSLAIDAYRDLTIDWARTPSGHYYSNKAPGPALLGLPFFWLYDRAHTAGERDRGRRDEIRFAGMATAERFLSLLLQAVPFALVVTLAAVSLRAVGASTGAIRFFFVASLFGNTAALFMNTFFGHGFTAVWTLALMLAAWHRRFAAVGLCFGLCVLGDFGSAMYLPALVLMLVWQRPRAAGWGSFLAGGIFPGLLWSVYHWRAFGSPFRLPTQFQNPIFVDLGHAHFWGVIDGIPHRDALAGLVWGPARGLLWTVPWSLVAVLAIGAHLRDSDRKRQPVLAFALVSFLGLLAMNAAFEQWQAGFSPGPRYLSAIFPALAFATALVFDRSPRWLQALLWLGVFVALWLTVLVFSVTLNVPPGAALWPFYANAVAAGGNRLLTRPPILIAGWWWLLPYFF